MGDGPDPPQHHEAREEVRPLPPELVQLGGPLVLLLGVPQQLRVLHSRGLGVSVGYKRALSVF
jgi:hypothetical protein